ncbi:MAG: GNAT family N-acetyltransferase, partial [Clostridia bacterium]
ENLKKLWIKAFHDSDSFTDWFFDNRFAPDYSACTYEDGQLISAMQSWPMFLNIRNRIVPSSIITGVNTEPAFAGRGYMGKTFRFYMAAMREKGIVLCPMMPLNMPTYFSRGFYPVTDTAFVSCPKDKPYICSHSQHYSILPLDMIENSSLLYTCYSRFSKDYSGIVMRSLSDFTLKMNDYISDGGKCAAAMKNREVVAYCIYYKHDDIYGEEFISNDKDSTMALVSNFSDTGYDMTMKMSAKNSVDVACLETEIKPQGAMGTVNAQKLMETVCNDREHIIRLTDDSLFCNSGTYYMDGAQADKTPHIEMEAGRLVQLITGYTSLEELEQRGQAKINDITAAAEISSMLPKLDCFIVDEY